VSEHAPSGRSGHLPGKRGGHTLATQLIGTWRLVSREDRTSAGERRIDPGLGADPLALLVFDRAGNFAAQFMKRDRSSSEVAVTARAVPNNSTAINGYDAYFGNYTVDEGSSSVRTTLEGSLSPEDVGSVFTRAMHVDGDTLTIKLATTSNDGQPVTRTLIWHRSI
jgi:lipocalin-like protein